MTKLVACFRDPEESFALLILVVDEAIPIQYYHDNIHNNDNLNSTNTLH